MTRLKLGFFGMSHLGLVYSTVYAHQGFDVLCYDSSNPLVLNLRNGLFPINEPGLDELALANKKRITYSNKLEDASLCDLAFLSLDVATDENGNAILKHLELLIEEVDYALPPHVPLIILSQVPIGFCDEKLKSMSRVLIYQVETLVFGNAVQRAIAPERFIIGFSSTAAKLPAKYLLTLQTFDCPKFTISYKSAELCKMAINFFLASTITSTNFLSEICEVVGANWNEVTPALKLDQRIGKFAYLSPGLGISGGNLERDINALRKVAETSQSQCEKFAKAILEMSTYQKGWAQKHLRKLIEKSEKNQNVIGLWGLSYKENTDSMKNSPSMEFLKSLPNDVQVIAFDPLVKSLPIPIPNSTLAEDQMTMLAKVDALFILTPWKHFKKNLSDVLRAFKGSLIVDPYSCIVMDVELPPSVSLVVLGNANARL
jgi:UDPglucose 6-dehydrogenase